jgi:hypothetical protein
MMKLYDGEYKVTSWFGPRTLANGDTRTHKGIDCVGLTSKNVLALCDATVVSSQIILDKTNATWEWGNYIKLDDGHGYYPHYCHLSKRLLAKGQKVKKGQAVGVEGQTGYSFGSHLHFEVRNAQGVSIDPQNYFTILEEREVDLIVAEVKRYKNIKDMPEWMQAYVMGWVDKGYIKGNSSGELDLSEDMIRTIIICERMMS